MTSKIRHRILEKWLANLLLDKHREIYHNMQTEQKMIVQFALMYNGPELCKQLVNGLKLSQKRIR